MNYILDMTWMTRQPFRHLRRTTISSTFVIQKPQADLRHRQTTTGSRNTWKPNSKQNRWPALLLFQRQQLAPLVEEYFIHSAIFSLPLDHKVEFSQLTFNAWNFSVQWIVCKQIISSAKRLFQIYFIVLIYFIIGQHFIQAFDNPF